MRWFVKLALAAFVVMDRVAAASAQQIPDPPVVDNPTSPGTLSGFLTSQLTPYEFWLTLVILTFGVIMSFFVMRFLGTSVQRKTEESIRALVVLWVIIATLTLIPPATATSKLPRRSACSVRSSATSSENRTAAVAEIRGLDRQPIPDVGLAGPVGVSRRHGR